MNDFAGKRILFIGIGFYDYEASIVARLRSYGAMVQAFIALPSSLRSGMLAPLFQRGNIRGLSLIRRHEERILRSARTTAFDFVLVIKSLDLRSEFLHALRDQQPGAEFILYQWDSMARLPGIEERIPYFHRILTFDRKDSHARPELQFRPLFYREEFQSTDSNAEDNEHDAVDLCFVGWLHSNRLDVIRRIQEIARTHDMSFFVYVYTGAFTSFKLALAGNVRNVHFKPLSYDKVMEANRRANVIVDLPHEAQSGMTMRAIEAVGLGKRLLTSANDVVQYDFFSSNTVQLLRPEEIRLNRDFICGPAARVPDEIRRRYSLDAWLADVFRLPAVTS